MKAILLRDISISAQSRILRVEAETYVQPDAAKPVAVKVLPPSITLLTEEEIKDPDRICARIQQAVNVLIRTYGVEAGPPSS